MKHETPAILQRRMRVARGEEPGDLLLRGGSVLSVFTGRVEHASVVIADGVIAGVGRHPWHAAETIDIHGAVICPGLIDAHIHIESTLLLPAALARFVVPRGTLALIADPHEIANVLGVRGVELMIRASEGLPLDCWFMAPSCVPASPFEAAGAVLGAEEIARLLRHDRVLGLAEMMNYPGVLAGDTDVMAKIAAAHAAGKVVDGHAPGVRGRDLMAYAAAGITSDHECTTREEALERDALGMLVQVREGSMARNLEEMMPTIGDGHLRRWCLCTDDILPADLLESGHIDGLLRRLVAHGVPAPLAVRHASLVPAQHYGLRGRGAVAPGWCADLVVFHDLLSFAATLVIKDGRVVARDGALTEESAPPSIEGEQTIHIREPAEADFRVAVTGRSARVIGIIPDQIVTRSLEMEVASAEGAWIFDPRIDAAMIACIQRHAKAGEAAHGRTGCALVSGFGFARHGALGSSVGHDAHNLVLAGTSAASMIAAAKAIEAMKGGLVVVEGTEVRAALPLPVAGLLSDQPIDVVAGNLNAIDEAAASLGCPLSAPCGTLSFLALSVIPALKITDRGLFDVEKFELV